MRRRTHPRKLKAQTFRHTPSPSSTRSLELGGGLGVETGVGAQNEPISPRDVGARSRPSAARFPGPSSRPACFTYSAKGLSFHRQDVGFRTGKFLNYSHEKEDCIRLIWRDLDSGPVRCERTSCLPPTCMGSF